MRSCPIYTQHCKHTRSILHVLQSGVCMSVCPSVSRCGGGAGSQEPCLATPPTPTSLPHPGNGTWNRYGPQSWWEPAGRAWASASTLARVLCVCMCVRIRVCMYVHGEPVCKYVQGGVTSQAGQMGRSRQGLPGVASSQVDSPQVSGRCDGVALRAELLGTQGPQPALFTVHMPTLDGR